MKFRSNATLVAAIGLLIFSGANSEAAHKIDLLKFSSTAKKAITLVSAAQCAAQLTSINNQVDQLMGENFNRKTLSSEGKAVVNNFWQARLTLRKKLVAYSAAGTLQPACVNAMRNTFRSFRFMEEYAGLATLAPNAWEDPTQTRVFSGGFPSFEQSPDLKKFAIQSGDVLVSYGMAYGSAAIAHVGEYAGSFSHMAMVYKNSAGELYTIEAHPEFGVKVAPIEKYLTDGKGRSALFRFKDTKMAALAAKRVYNIAYKADSSGNTIPYDFNMDINDHTKLFCTEVVKYAFDLAAKEMKTKVTVPAFPTRIVMKNSYILDSFGIETRSTFAPSDIEVDPQFELLAEWRDLARVRLMHHQQSALQSEFKWLDSLKYNYRSDLETILASHILFGARHNPMFEGLVDDMIPPDLSQPTLEAVVQVYLVSEAIHDSLVDKDKAIEGTNTPLMTWSQLLSQTEQIRKDDLAAYEARIHWIAAQNAKLKAEGKMQDQGFKMPFMSEWHYMLRSNAE